MNAITIALYLGIFFMVFSFLLFIISEMNKASADRELFRQKELTKSFMKDKK